MKKFYSILATAILATLFSGQVMAQATFTSANAGNWNASATWTRTSGTDADGIPDADDAVIIGALDHTVTVNVDASCTSLTFPNNQTVATTVTVSSGFTLNVSETITIPRGNSGSQTNTLNVGAGSVNANTIAFTNDGSNSRHRILISTGTLTVTGNITTDGSGASAAITFSGAGTLKIGGGLFSTGGGSFTASTGTVEYNGSGAQTVDNISYYNLKLSGGGAKTAGGAITVTGTVTFVSGVLNTTSTNLLTLADNATVSGASNSSYVDGPVRKTGNDAFTFPIGDGGYYTPLAIAAPSVNTNQYTAQYFFADASTFASAPAGGSVSNKEYWKLDRNSGTSTPAVTFYYDHPGRGYGYAGGFGFNVMSVAAGGGTWATAGGAISYTTSTTPKSVSKSLSTYSLFFTLGNPSNSNGAVLPVKYGVVKASEKGRGVQIDWTAYDEHYLAGYQIERSADGIHFNAIGEVAAKNVTTETQYGFFDALPLSGTSFYRIRNLDIDGKSGLSNIVKINLNKNIKTISIYPNPLRGNRVSFQTSELAQGTYNVELINAVGMRVFAQTISHAGGAINQGLSLPSNLKSGQYTLRINGNTPSSNHQLIILQ